MIIKNIYHMDLYHEDVQMLPQYFVVMTRGKTKAKYYLEETQNICTWPLLLY